MQVNQGALVASSTSTVAIDKFIAKVISDEETQVTCEEVTFDAKSLDCYPWHIKNKYYEADVHFIHMKERDLVGSSFCDVVQAIILIFSADDEQSFKDAKLWSPFVSQFDCEVRILVCERVTEETSVKRSDVHEWCIKNTFELVELDPVIECDEEVEDDFVESNSYLRIRQALNAHTWPVMNLGTPPEYKPSEKFSDLREFNLPKRPSESSKRVDKLLEETTQILGDLETGDSAFENLFEKFRDMKGEYLTLHSQSSNGLFFFLTTQRKRVNWRERIVVSTPRKLQSLSGRRSVATRVKFKTLSLNKHIPPHAFDVHFSLSQCVRSR